MESIQIQGILLTTVLGKSYMGHLERIERETNLIVARIWGNKDFPAKIPIHQAGDPFNCRVIA
jgi:hypothetical protein